MIFCSHINGNIIVRPMGRTQAETRYILDTVLEHLPLVTGMDVYVIQKNGTDQSCSNDEFGCSTNNLIGRKGHRTNKGCLRMQSEYILVVNGYLEDKMFEYTLRKFQKWLCRLAKRVQIIDVMVEIKEYKDKIIIRNHKDIYGKMFENPSWGSENSNNWCEYLMWDRAKNSRFPMMLAYKYFDDDEENNKEVERRLKYQREG